MPDLAHSIAVRRSRWSGPAWTSVGSWFTPELFCTARDRLKPPATLFGGAITARSTDSPLAWGKAKVPMKGLERFVSWSSLWLRAEGHGAAYTNRKGSGASEAWVDGWCHGTVVVAMDPLGRASEPLQTGIRLARQHSRRLAVLGLVRDPSHWMHCAPVATPWTWQSIRTHDIDEAVQRCGMLVGGIPMDISVSFALYRT